MNKYVSFLSICFYSPLAFGGVLDVFRLEDGHTNWQYVANTGGSLLILALIYTVFRLSISQRTARKYNRELEEIRNKLELRVQERTATLDESNQLLQESNEALAGEISKHLATTDKLRVSELYIKNILRRMPLMLVGLDNHGNITQWNRGAEETSGISAESALGTNLWETYPTITVTPQQIKQVQEQKKKITIKHSQRGQYHFDITIYPLEEQSDTGVVILLNDVTQRVQAENMLIQRDKMSSMGELAASMAHDIDTPLQGILQNIRKVINNNNSDSENSSSVLLQEAISQGQQASAVINNLLDFSRNRSVEKKPVDITQVIDHCLELAGSVLSVPSGLKFRDIHIEKNYAADLPLIPCFVSEIQQVFLSLFRHACHALGEVDKATHSPTIHIEVNDFYDSLWIKVQHNGKGISYEEQQFIFEPFFNNDVKDTDYDAGKRLSFSHFIVTEQHRGQMAVTSDVEVGTTFHIQLQLK